MTATGERARQPAEPMGPGAAGFTLVEVLVALALTSAAVVVLASALRVGLGAWERQERSDSQRRLLYAIPWAMARDLGGRVRLRPVPGGGMKVLPLCGSPNALAFWTVYGPEGSPGQGLHLVGYVHREDSARLEVYRLRLAADVDASEETRRLASGETDSWEPLGAYPQVESFQLDYGVEEEGAEPRDLEWRSEWPCSDGMEVPRAVRVRISLGPRDRSDPKTFYLLTKPAQL